METTPTWLEVAHHAGSSFVFIVLCRHLIARFLPAGRIQLVHTHTLDLRTLRKHCPLLPSFLPFFLPVTPLGPRFYTWYPPTPSVYPATISLPANQFLTLGQQVNYRRDLLLWSSRAEQQFRQVKNFISLSVVEHVKGKKMNTVHMHIPRRL